MLKKCYKVAMQMNKAGTRRRRLLPAIIVVLGMLALVAGCGGGNDDGESTGSSVASGQAAEGGEAAGGGASGEGPGKAGSGQSGQAQGGAGGTGTGSEGGAAGGGSQGGEGSPGQGSSGSGDRVPEGGSSGGGGNEAKTAFVKEAEQVCKKWGAKVKKDSQRNYKGDLNGSAKQVKQGIASLVRAFKAYAIPDVESELKELRGLSVPAGAEEASLAAIAAVEELIKRSKQDPEAILLVGKGLKQAEAIAGKQGFVACGTLVGER